MGDLDHRHMAPPFLRLVERTATPAGDAVLKWDLRLTQPNVAQLPVSTLHSLEHFLNLHFKATGAPVPLAAPLGCLTGLYLVAIGVDDFNVMADLVAGALESVLAADEVPLANEIDCGAASMHSLVAAQQAARWLLSRREEWAQPLTLAPASMTAGS